jgi:hypothetical protein
MRGANRRQGTAITLFSGTNFTVGLNSWFCIGMEDGHSGLYRIGDQSVNFREK